MSSNYVCKVKPGSISIVNKATDSTVCNFSSSGFSGSGILSSYLEAADSGTAIEIEPKTAGRDIKFINGDVKINDNLYVSAATGGTPSAIKYYEEYNTDLTFSGALAGNNFTTHFVAFNYTCIVHFRSAIGTSLGAFTIDTPAGSIPSRFAPLGNILAIVQVADNSFPVIGSVIIYGPPTNSFCFGVGLETVAFQATGICGITICSICYALNLY